MADAGDQSYLDALLAEAAKKYPFIKQHNPLLAMGSGQNDYAETWPAGETGASDAPRPSQFPMDRVGVQVFRPQAFSHDDLAAEMLHIDPYANGTRRMLLDSFTPQQVAALTKQSADYKQSIDMGLPHEKAIANATDSAMRGYTVGQWPEGANAAMNYSAGQKRMLDSLKGYMTTGIYPSSFDLAFAK